MVKGCKKVASLKPISLLLAISFLLIFSVGGVLGIHTSEADLQPEWSVPGVTNSYEAEICNTGGNSIDEVRIMQNPHYAGFTCDSKTDWTLIPVSNFPDP